MPFKHKPDTGLHDWDKLKTEYETEKEKAKDDDEKEEGFFSKLSRSLKQPLE
jgi:hypothetical protein